MGTLQTTNVRMVYGHPQSGEGLVAIDRLSLTVGTGTFVSIVGPSGCGKTTFLKIVDGLLVPTAGQLLLDGRRINGPGPDRGMVFQDAALFPWFTVLRNAAYGLECQGLRPSEAQARARLYLQLVGLHGVDRYYPHQLSGGMQQRVNLARALAVDPSLLLMDEPFAALDAHTRELMQAELLRIWETAGKTVLFITHQISEAIYLSDRVIVMGARPGRVIADIVVPFPRPRPLRVKRTPRFLELEDHVWDLIAAPLGGSSERVTGDMRAGG